MGTPDHVDLLVEFLRSGCAKPEDSRTVLGIALLANGDEALFAELDARSDVLDSPLLADILKVARSEQIARILWSPIGLHLSANRFESLLNRILANRPSDASIYEAVGGAVDFLRHHSDAFLLPQDSLCHLVRSGNAQARIVALKALRYSSTSHDCYVRYILRSLESDNEEERIGALHCLGELIENTSKDAFTSLGTDLLRELDRSLESWSTLGDPDLRMAAEAHRWKLRTWTQEG